MYVKLNRLINVNYHMYGSSYTFILYLYLVNVYLKLPGKHMMHRIFRSSILIQLCAKLGEVN